MDKKENSSKATNLTNLNNNYNFETINGMVNFSLLA